MATNVYDEIIQAITDAGLFVSGPRYYDDPDCSWHRIIPASKLRNEGGYTGNSFWISFDDDDWFIGTWGGRIYKIRDSQNIAGMSIEWLSSNPDSTRPDFDKWLADKFELTLIDKDAFRPSRIARSNKDSGSDV